jgi:hypothetical protein
MGFFINQIANANNCQNNYDGNEFMIFNPAKNFLPHNLVRIFADRPKSQRV